MNDSIPRHAFRDHQALIWGGIACMLAVLLVGCSDESGAPGGAKAPQPVDHESAQVKRMVESEEMVLQLTPLLRAIGASMVNGSRDDLPEAVAGDASIAPWEDLDPNHYWKNASFGTLAGTFEGDAFVMKTKFEGVRRGDDRTIVGVKAKQKLVWKKDADDQWHLVKWEPLSFATDTSAKPLFEEVLDRVLLDPGAYQLARRNLLSEIIVKSLAREPVSVPYYSFPSPPDVESTYGYPTVSVVDYDGDGHDDLFVTAKWSPPQLLRNRGDGTFEDVTEKAGINPKNCVNFAVFADFDNDGDPDALLGRTLERTLYYLNDGGTFRHVTDELTDLGDQYFVTCAAVADINRDGLLDVYLSTYNSDGDLPAERIARYFPPGQLEKVNKLKEKGHAFLDARGIPNILLMNRGGGRLERAGGAVVELWRKSYQPLWFDADGDGDDDLYVCNDFAPDTFLRNDTPRGAAEPVFVDAYAQAFPEGQMAFGMGVSAGDYDNDGDLDLFVTNMYSKAGNRIIPQISNVDPRFEVAARGNFLYRNDGGRFKQVAEADGAETKVGWAFGGQFADFNNDGWLDLYIPSGLYTAPKAVATEVDL